MKNLVPEKYIKSKGEPQEIFGDDVHVQKRGYKSLRRQFGVNGLCADIFLKSIWEPGLLLEHKTNGDIAHAFDQIMETAPYINRNKNYTTKLAVIVLESNKIKKNFQRVFKFMGWKEDSKKPKRKILYIKKGGKWRPQFIINNRGKKIPIFDKTYYK